MKELTSPRTEQHTDNKTTTDTHRNLSYHLPKDPASSQPRRERFDGDFQKIVTFLRRWGSEYGWGFGMKESMRILRMRGWSGYLW